MPFSVSDLPDQTGRTYVITGANSGLGLSSTHALAAKGATVIMACRNAEKAADAVAQVRAAVPEARLEVLPLDLASLASIRAFPGLLGDRPIDVLLNNAGIMAIPQTRTADGFEMQFGTNHLGHFALTALLWPRLRDRAGARVVNVSSMAHRTGKMTFDDLMRERSYARWSVYGQSKLANLLFTFELARRAAAAGRPTLVAAAHPGYSDTNLQFVGPEMDRSGFARWLSGIGNRLFSQPADQGALPQLYAATMPDVANADYIGPDGFYEVWGFPKKVGCTKAARNEADQARLWVESERLTGLKFEV